MNETGYFASMNYTGKHLHIDNYKDESTPFVEAIAWERQDKTMDIFFDDFKDDEELKALFGDKGHYYDDVIGVFLYNVKTDEEAYEMFCNWVDKVLYPYRTSRED
ncbi:hypothetical protein [Domibacillus robiginosus]|uniref:hypothetical protein n=1 Tax=Domibacillus robiginosus TaxID=1071054 RepID=UPI00067E3219|nr:hypothetical protein [Domibacillus robiginosus]